MTQTDLADKRYDFDISSQTLLRGDNTVSIQLDMIGSGKKVLELGCATGRVSRLLKEIKNCEVTGVEFSASAAELAHPYCADLLIGNLESSEFCSTIEGQFDVILAGDVLEHLRNPEMALDHLKRNLSSDGYWVISTPNVAHWSMRRNLLLGKFDYTQTGMMDRTHVTWFTYKSLRQMLKDTGYKVEEERGVYTLPAQKALRLSRVAMMLGNYKIFRSLLAFQMIMKARLQL